MGNLTPAQKISAKEAFDLLDEDHDNCLMPEKLGDLLRVLGLSPTNEQIEEFKKDLKGKNLNFNEFLGIYSKMLGKQDKKDDLIKEFKKLDKNNNGFITNADLLGLLQNYGNDLSSDEINSIIKYLNPDNSENINIEQLANNLIAQ